MIDFGGNIVPYLYLHKYSQFRLGGRLPDPALLERDVRRGDFNLLK